VTAHLGLLARYLGRVQDASAHFAVAAEADAAAGAALAARTREWAAGTVPVAGDEAALFRRDGEVWTLRYAGQTARLRDSKGLRDLEVLLSRPGERSRPTGSGCARLTARTARPTPTLGHWPRSARRCWPSCRL
jgi:hypothetical protein